MLLVAALAAVSVIAACGGSDSSSDAATATTVASDGSAVTVTMGSPDEYSMVPEPTEVAAGTVTFTVVNDGEMEHEMVVIKTDKGAANLGTESGEADETGAVDEIVLGPGEQGTLVVDLEAGAYALVCNLPGHYAAGMYADFTVT
jgi:uncharacterized cupredoxin-like copper-binding protein